MDRATIENSITTFGRGGPIWIVDDAKGRSRRVLAVAADEAARDQGAALSSCGDSPMRLVAADPEEVGLPREIPDRWAGESVAHVTRYDGVLVSATPEEAAVDLARLAGLRAAALICETAGSRSGAVEADESTTPVISVDDLVTFRWQSEVLIERTSQAFLPTPVAEFTAVGYRAKVTRSEHIALVLGDVAGRENVLTRVHSACLTGDVFSSLRCDCGDQLRLSMEVIAEAGVGVIVYNPEHEGRGTGLLDKLAAYELQEQGWDTVDANLKIGHAADSRHYGIDAQIILDLGVSTIRLLTNNPQKVDQLRLFGVDVRERVPIWTERNPHNQFYIDTKIERLGHLRSPT
jgi:3,4-dihydroxy 2-butanone 4-phosphate synthase/GTP cyclohydrolase II